MANAVRTIKQVTDPAKIVTDPVMLRELARQGIDTRFVEFFQDYAPRSKGKEHSPYAKFYRDLKSNKRVMVVSGLPMVKPDGKKIEAGWRKQGNRYFSKANLFSAVVNPAGVKITCDNDQPDGTKKDEQVTWQPQLFLNGIEQTCDKATLLETDPANQFYHQNVLEWDYGVCKRRIRIIEGRFRERWVFEANPHSSVRIKHNFSGSLRISLGAAFDAEGNPLKTHVVGDEEAVDATEFDQAAYPVEIGSSATFYPDPLTSLDGYIGPNLGSTNGIDWSELMAYSGTCAKGVDGDSLHGVYFYSSDQTNKWFLNYRAAILFDTSGLPDEAEISDAVLSFYGEKKGDAANRAPTVNVYASNPASDTVLVDGDYETFGSVAFCDTPITYAGWYVGLPGTANSFVLNAAGIAAIDKTGISKFAQRNANYDVPVNDPPWVIPLQHTYIRTWSAEKGTGYKPKLVVTYTSVPTVSTDPATEVGQTTAVLNGILDDDGGYTCECGFEWGETVAYGNTTPTQSRTTGQTFAQPITGLAPNTTYHFRAIATNSMGTRYGADRSFQSWLFETDVPFTITGQLFFSPIIGREVYVIDRGTNFWKYNLGTKQWTELASPNYTGSYAYRTLVPDSITNPTKLYCPSEHSHTVGANYGDAMRISAYDIAGNSWTDSARVPPYALQLNVNDKTGFQVGEIVQGNSSGATAFIKGIGFDYLTVVPQTDTRFTQAEEVEGQTSGATTDLWGGGHSFGTSPNWAYGGGQNIKSIVYKDATHIYCWQALYSYQATGQYYYSDARCVCYNPTADTWEAFSANDYQNTTYSLYVQHHRCAAINAAGTIIYSGEIYGYKYCKYTLATDTYAATAITGGRAFSFAHIKNKLPYTTTSTMRQGYLDTADDSENDDQFTENMERDSGYGNYFGIADDLTVIIAHAKSTAPELMSQGIVAPMVTTDPASSIEQTTATLNGTLDADGGKACDCSFEYGETTDYGTETPTESKTTGETFSQPITGLAPNKTYHFRAIATNSAGTVNGADRSLTTNLAPVINRAHALSREEL